MDTSVELLFCEALLNRKYHLCLQFLNGSRIHKNQKEFEPILRTFFMKPENSEFKIMFHQHFEKTKEGFWIIKSTYHYGLGIH